MIETNRLNVYAASHDVMEDLIERQIVEKLKAAYMETLERIPKYPGQWE